jgi:hypothetical protein
MTAQLETPFNENAPRRREWCVGARVDCMQPETSDENLECQVVS